MDRCAQRKRAEAESAEHARAVNAAVANGAPARRARPVLLPGTAATAALDAMSPRDKEP